MSFDQLTRQLSLTVGQHLGHAARLVPQVGAAVACRALLDRGTDARLLGEASVIAAAPRVEVPTASVAELKRGDVVEVLGRRWKVVSAPRRSGDGGWWSADVQDDGPVPGPVP